MEFLLPVFVGSHLVPSMIATESSHLLTRFVSKATIKASGYSRLFRGSSFAPAALRTISVASSAAPTTSTRTMNILAHLVSSDGVRKSVCVNFGVPESRRMCRHHHHCVRGLLSICVALSRWGIQLPHGANRSKDGILFHPMNFYQ